MAKRIITTENLEEDVKIESHLRPTLLKDYIGQEKAKETLKIYIEAAKARGESLDHVLFYGPPGLGKTTLAGIIANEMEVNVKITSGPAIEKPGEMAAILNNLQEGDVLFVDEIHRLNRQVEEVLYPAMEDYVIDIMIGKGAGARSIRLDLPHFTLVGATTRAGMLTAPLRDRFGVVQRLEFYTEEDDHHALGGCTWRGDRCKRCIRACKAFQGNPASGESPVKAGERFRAGQVRWTDYGRSGKLCAGSFGCGSLWA